MSDYGFTPGPWFAHGFAYPEGVAGDVFSKDGDNVLACTAICRVVEPVSKMAHDLRRPPIDALRAIARKEAARPIIEANARLVAASPTLLEALEAVMREFFPHPTPDEYPELRDARAAIALATGKDR